jgi:xanthine dehydrogenase accessory factor
VTDPQHDPTNHQHDPTDHQHDPTDHQHDPTDHQHDPACEVAHGTAPAEPALDRDLVAVYATPVSAVLLRWGRELGFRTRLVEPDATRVTDAHRDVADEVFHDPSGATIGAGADVVVTDHDRDDLGPVMAPLLQAGPRWMGIMGSPRHAAPHGPALRAEGVAEHLIATVHRPIGLDIGSKAPAEIALSTLAGLLADRNGRTGR